MGARQEKYFAAANSADGFVNYFPQIFGEGGCQRLYVIKGGPGTGKSCFMKQVGARAEKRGMPVTYYYCSSDADSLDGLMIGNGKIGILDGTAPHVWEPHLAGAFEQIVNLGDFWNADLLASRKREIAHLTKKKGECYQNAYRYLAAYGQVMRTLAIGAEAMLEKEKAERAAERLVKKYGCTGKGFCESVGLCDSLGMGGRVRLDTYEEFADTLYTVEGVEDTSFLFFDALYKACRHHGVNVRISRDPLLPERIDALTMVDSAVTFSKEGDGEIIHMRRFINDEAHRQCRRERRRDLLLGAQLVKCAEQCLQEAKQHHFSVEALFYDAMDFVAKEQFTEMFCKKVIENGF